MVPKVYYHVHKNPILISALRNVNPDHILIASVTEAAIDYGPSPKNVTSITILLNY